MTNVQILKTLYRVNDRFDVLYDADEATDGGAYVQAWVWVYDEDVEKETK